MATDATAAGERAEQRGALHFPLQDDERVIALCRRHWLFLYPRLIIMALFALVPLTVVSLLLAAADAYDDVAPIFWIVSAAYLLFWAIRIFFTWYRYNNDIWVITNQRVVDSLKTTPFNLKLSTADLVNVQDMTVERNGILRTLFDYGDIVCQTAAEGMDFRLSGIPDPRGVQALVDRERDRERMRGR